MNLSASTRRRIGAGLIATITAIAFAAIAQPAAAAPGPGGRVVPHSTPDLSHAKRVGAPAASARVDFGVLLGMRHSDQAVATLERLSEPSSSDYGHWLTDAQFRAAYAPTAATVASVQTWLRRQGFTVEQTLPSGMYLEASGTASRIERVFATHLATVQVHGHEVRANTTALHFPAGTPTTVIDAVSGIIGINQAGTLKQPADTLPGPPPGAHYGVQPCSSYDGQKIAADKPEAYGKHQPYVVCGYTPAQYESAYGESSLLRHGIDGHGITIAITDAYASPTIRRDVKTYSRRHQLPTFRGRQFRQITPPANGYDLVSECGAQGWYGEETLDVEAAHAMAPGASIVYVGASDCGSGLDEAWAESIDNHVADVITNSWTFGTDDIGLITVPEEMFYEQFSMEAALTGITVTFASGDAGDGTNGGTDLAAKTVGFPADIPWVTGVGGTSVGIGQSGQWLWEHGWQSDYSTLTKGAWAPAPPGVYSSGGGGGTSALFTQPFYQRGRVPASISEYFGSTPMRAVPDVSMPGDPNTGFLVGQTQQFPDGTYYAEYRIGGTSLASPLMAGVFALAGQLAHRPVGFANPQLYALLGTPAVHDVTAPRSPTARVRTDYTNFLDRSQGYTYRLETIDVQQTTIHSAPGYDAETGVGTPHGPAFFWAMALLSNVSVHATG